MKVLLAVDDSDASRDAVAFAQRLLRPDDDVVVIHAMSTHPPLAMPAGGLAGLAGYPPYAAIGAPIETQRAEGLRDPDQIAQATVDAAATAVDADDTTVTVGDPVDRVVSIAEDEGIELIIVGTSDPGLFSRILTGRSVSRDIIDKAGCSVLLVRSPD